MKKVLIITTHRRDRAPNQRFRFEQYLSFLERQGFQCEMAPLLNEQDDKLFYSQGNFIGKAIIAFKAALIRLNNVIARNQYAIIFICREGYFTGTTFFEEALKKSKAKIVYDFDDAIWHFDVSDANKNIGWLKNPGKTARLISLADLVFAGNQYLADYAKHHNDHIVIVPTTIDTEEYKPVIRKLKETVCIGWSGSVTTIKHFQMALPFLEQLKNKYGDKINIKVIGDGNFKHTGLGISGIPWKKETELQELQEIDIGIMPLPDDEWSKGKCGLKGLQYMALGIATIMSPVGVNTEIIEDGENGYLASSLEEWERKISLLIDDASLRSRIGMAGRMTVEDKYSVKSWENKYLNYFQRLTE